MNERLLTVHEAAAELKLNAQTVREWLRSGKLRGLRTTENGRWRVPESALVESLTPGAQRASEVTREEAKAKGFGFLKDRIRGSDAFLESKHAEARAELERDEARHARRGVAA